MTQDDLAVARLRKWKLDPITFVRDEFQVEPDEWQKEALSVFPRVNRIALKACKGPGKTAVLAWLILNFLVTRPHCRIGCVSITGDNLAQNLWPELSKWIGRSPFIDSLFTWTKTAIVHKSYPATWWAQARSWAKQADQERQADALAGLHEKHAMAVLDESGGIPQGVMATADAVLSTGGDTKVLQAGNPTHTDGPLYRACTTDRDLWHVITITGDPDDPRRSPRIDPAWARQQIKSYGRDNPWVKVNVLGEFPPASINALLGVEEVEAAMRRHHRKDAYEWAQKRLGIDAARFGDDPWIIFPRQGLAAWRPVVLRQPRTTLVTARIAKAFNDWHPEAMFIDDTGHWGHGVVDQCIAASLPITPVIFSDPATTKRYRNRRAEMYIEASNWVKRGGALPNDPELSQELTAHTYTFVGGVFVLEDKDQVKAKIGRSPNKSDGLALTFAEPEMPGDLIEKLRGANHVKHDADPFVDAHRENLGLDEVGRGRVIHDADPFEREGVL